MTVAPPARLFDAEGKPLELVLYKHDMCGYCRRVMAVVAELGLPLATRDTLRQAGARAEAISLGGRSQVPMLLINGRPMYESEEIIDYLRHRVRLGAG